MKPTVAYIAGLIAGLVHHHLPGVLPGVQIEQVYDGDDYAPELRIHIKGHGFRVIVAELR